MDCYSNYPDYRHQMGGNSYYPYNQTAAMRYPTQISPMYRGNGSSGSVNTNMYNDYNRFGYQNQSYGYNTNNSYLREGFSGYHQNNFYNNSYGYEGYRYSYNQREQYNAENLYNTRNGYPMRESYHPYFQQSNSSREIYPNQYSAVDVNSNHHPTGAIYGEYPTAPSTPFPNGPNSLPPTMPNATGRWSEYIINQRIFLFLFSFYVSFFFSFIFIFLFFDNKNVFGTKIDLYIIFMNSLFVYKRGLQNKHLTY